MGERARSASVATSTGFVQPVRIIKEGTVTVKVLFFARPRHLTLTSAELLVFESKGEDAKQKFDLVHTSVKADKDSNIFLVEGGSEKMSFRCSSPDERTAWVRAISDAIDQAKAAYQQQVFQQIQQLQGGRGIPPTPLPSQSNYPPTAYPTPASPPGGRHPLSSSGASSRRPARQVPLSNPPTAVPSAVPTATVATRQAPPVSQPQPQLPPQPQPHQLQTSHSQPQTTTQPLPAQPQPHPQPQQPAYPTLATSSLSSSTTPLVSSTSIPSSSSSTAATSTPHPQVQPLINTNPHGAVFPESGFFPSTPSGTPAMSQTAIFDASVLALMPEVRELFQPVQRWQPPVPETMKLRVDRDPNLQSYLEKYRETYPDLFADPTFIFPDQDNVCQPTSTNRTPGGAHGGGTTTSEILSAAAAGYPGAYQAAAPSRPIGLGARRRTTTNVTSSYYYPQYAQQPTARPPTTYVSYSRY